MSPDDITIVMQGIVVDDKGIDRSIINNIRKVTQHFPRCKIIISTWKMEPERNAQFCKLARYLGFAYIINDDPGITSKIKDGIRYVSNVNRMIVSSLCGIQLASASFVIKMRTDSYFTSDAIIDLLERYIVNDKFERHVGYSVFNHMVLNYNLFSRNARGYLPYLFHPGDILFCGYKDDVMSIFDVELADERIFKISKHGYFYTIMNYVPEQYILVKCIEKRTGLQVYSGNSQINNKLIVESEMYYINNFIPCDSGNIAFCWRKHKSHYHNKGRYSVYDYSDWMRVYNKSMRGLRTPIDRKFMIKKWLRFS
ncbi:WavE lipopolysaccharide synthesis [Candidatus Sodalis endolongispinus]|uniref:WavE lipopolysaccharide synthesis n=1 Tax=Candidatus Sodalis endolongispinus TaxID=2812662 RepID=A0ABS5Y9J4_9GAMM|nr:WavE lipopolysaccharide synthesis family protein [Candidatus Sodalis endolongispinus]MBT9431675.1 WavE lipopolysaccharide synthesis [Candidatus Sodalis endolongispinus]